MKSLRWIFTNTSRKEHHEDSISEGSGTHSQGHHRPETHTRADLQQKDDGSFNNDSIASSSTTAHHWGLHSGIYTPFISPRSSRNSQNYLHLPFHIDPLPTPISTPRTHIQSPRKRSRIVVRRGISLISALNAPKGGEKCKSTTFDS